MSDATMGIRKIDRVHPFGVVGNLRRRRVTTREIGRFKYRETTPSWDLPLPRRNLISISSIWLPSVIYSQALSRKRGSAASWQKLLSQESFSRSVEIVLDGQSDASIKTRTAFR